MTFCAVETKESRGLDSISASSKDVTISQSRRLVIPITSFRSIQIAYSDAYARIEPGIAFVDSVAHNLTVGRMDISVNRCRLDNCQSIKGVNINKRGPFRRALRSKWQPCSGSERNVWVSSGHDGRGQESARDAIAKPLLFATTSTMVQLSTPLIAHAAENAPEGTFDLILKTTEALGPLGGVFFVCAVVVCECIPLFPTTPLSLASGILFGPQKGAMLVLGGTTLASIVAFTVARGFGRPLAEKIISAEMSGDSHDEESSSLIQQKLKDVESVIESGTFWQQAGSVLALRLTPVVPFSASNYVLGLSPLPLGPYLTGTFVGMSFWSVVYASLGAGGRAVLSKGVEADTLLAELLETTGKVTSKAGVAAVLGAAIAGFVFFGKNRFFGSDDTTHVEEPEPVNTTLSDSEEETVSTLGSTRKMHYPAADTGFYGEKQ